MRIYMWIHNTCWGGIAQPIISILLFFSFPLENVSLHTHANTSRNSLAVFVLALMSIRFFALFFHLHDFLLTISFRAAYVARINIDSWAKAATCEHASKSFGAVMRYVCVKLLTISVVNGFFFFCWSRVFVKIKPKADGWADWIRIPFLALYSSDSILGRRFVLV